MRRSRGRCKRGGSRPPAGTWGGPEGGAVPGGGHRQRPGGSGAAPGGSPGTGLREKRGDRGRSEPPRVPSGLGALLSSSRGANLLRIPPNPLRSPRISSGASESPQDTPESPQESPNPLSSSHSSGCGELCAGGTIPCSS